MSRKKSSSLQWSEALTQAIQSAVKPLADDVKEVKADIQELKLGVAKRDEVYDKALMDEKLKGITEEITAMKAFVWKAIGALGTGIILLVNIYQHITIH